MMPCATSQGPIRKSNATAASFEGDVLLIGQNTDKIIEVQHFLVRSLFQERSSPDFSLIPGSSPRCHHFHSSKSFQGHNRPTRPQHSLHDFDSHLDEACT
uniref:Uncharacterized protein n=1 Tax=Lygus hesperus TaxID=30085 RepID=A0A146M980_LYGHE